MAKGKAGKRTAKAVPKFGPSRAGTRKESKRRVVPASGQQKEGAQEEVVEGPNPYDIFQNRRQRRPVLGEKVRGERRDLAKSRTAAVANRTKGLLKDVIGDRRTSKFRDARLGGDAGVAEEVGNRSSVQRLVKLRQRQAKRSFALGGAADDTGNQELTHGGKPLAGMEDAELRKGGDLDDEEDVEFDPDNPVEGHSRLKRMEAAKEREEQEKQLGKLDADFGDILGELEFRPPKAQQLKLEAPRTTKTAPDDYERLLKELAFERKATATDRTKSPEEIARERAEQLEALERERAQRVSADTGTAKADGDDEDNAEGESDEDGLPTGPGDAKQADAAGEAEEEESEEESEGEESEEEHASAVDDVPSAGDDQDEDDRLGEECIALLAAREAGVVDIMANDKNESGLPYKFDCPSRTRAVASLLADKSPKTAMKVVQRIRTCTAATLAPENRDKLRNFFVALLEYAIDVVARSDGDLSARGMQVLYALRPLLVEMAREHPDEAHLFFKERLAVLGPDTVPKVTELCSFKLIALIFPVTDFQHPITTPAAVLLDLWAARIAALGSGITDLVSEAVFLWGVFYDFLVPARRFCPSFFQLGIAILESCWASVRAGRTQVADVAADISAALLKTLRLFHEADRLAAHVAAQNLMRPPLRVALETSPEGVVRTQISSLLSAMEQLCSEGLQPLALFETAPPQIQTLEPIFHEIGDAPRRRGMDLTDTQRLKKKLNEERRAAARQLRRDAATMQQLQGHKDDKRRSAQAVERARVRNIMAVEKQELKLLATENAGGMDTSLQAYSKTKARKRENKRMGGNSTADSGGAPGKPHTEGPRGAKQARKKGK